MRRCWGNLISVSLVVSRADARARVGYRALGVAGVALAAHQIPADFTDPDALGNANANGELLLQGLVYGLDFCY